MDQNKIKNEWKKYFNYDLELSDMKDFIRLEIYTMFFVLLFETVLLIISKNNNIFVDKNYYLYLLSYFLFWILSLLLGYLNKKYKIKFILFISLIIHPRFWGMTLFLGVILLYSFFEINFYVILIFILYLLSFILVFFDEKIIEKIAWFTDTKNNNLIKSILTLLFFVFMIFGNTRYVIRIFGISNNGLIRLIIGCFIITYYFILQSVSKILLLSKNKKGI